ncbi:MAG: TRAP transporter large permease [Syntrophomonadaceae bacterium]|nr:TRAP transporter large permease [Syntrophomonadaceae bacterium]
MILIFLRMPIAYAMAITGFVGFSYMTSASAGMNMVVRELYSSFSSYTLTVIPMFVWMGFLAYYSGIGTRLYVFAYRMIGHWPAGLAIATQLACAVFGAICGSNTATAATMGAIAMPEMKKYNYDHSLSTASVAAGGVLGVLIPPSVIFIVYGMATQQSIGKLFIAGALPGILLMLLYMAVIFIWARKRPEIGPSGPRFTWRERLTALQGGLLEVIIIFALSMGGLFAGWFTATEAGAVGAIGVLLVSLAGRNLSWDNFKRSLFDTTKTTAMIMLLVAGSVIFGRFMAVSRIPFEAANWAATLDMAPFMVMGLILLVYLIMGCFIDALAMILLTIPIFYPIAVETLGFDPIWFGVIIVLVVAMGVITPPVGMNVYIIKAVAPYVPLDVIFRGIWPFLLAIIICVIMLIIFPQIATFLPGLLST